MRNRSYLRGIATKLFLLISAFIYLPNLGYSQLHSYVSNFSTTNYKIVNVSQVIPDIAPPNPATGRGDGYVVVGTVQDVTDSRYHAYLTLYNSNDVQIWSRVYNLSIGGSDADIWGISVAQDAGDGFAITGRCITSAGKKPVFLFKTDADGYFAGTNYFADTINSKDHGLSAPVKVLMGSSKILVLGTNKWTVTQPNNLASMVVEYNYSGAYVTEFIVHSTTASFGELATDMVQDNNGIIYVLADVKNSSTGYTSKFSVSKLNWLASSRSSIFVWGKEYSLTSSGSSIDHLRTTGISLNNGGFAVSFNVSSDPSFTSTVNPCLVIGNLTTGALNYLRKFTGLSYNTFTTGLTETVVSSNPQYEISGYTNNGTRTYSVGIYTDNVGIPTSTYPIISYVPSSTNTGTTISDSFTSVSPFGGGISFVGVANTNNNGTANIYQYRVAVNSSGSNNDNSCNSIGSLSYSNLNYTSTNNTFETDYGNVTPNSVNKYVAIPSQIDITSCNGNFKKATGFGNTQENQIYFYPIPTSNLLSIEGIDNERLNEISVFDATGKKISCTFTIQTSKIDLETSKFPSGIYYFRIIFGNGFVVSDKFLVEN